MQVFLRRIGSLSLHFHPVAPVNDGYLRLLLSPCYYFDLSLQAVLVVVLIACSTRINSTVKSCISPCSFLSLACFSNGSRLLK